MLAAKCKPEEHLFVKGIQNAKLTIYYSFVFAEALQFL